MCDFPPPSEIMRARRPYLYSDSSTSGAYTLSRSEFSHFLDTLTERNQHKEFEIFCRHLCERLICPNLRTQTGPDGGGDGKVDTETYAVAPEISDRWFIGEGNSGQERWGFAISAKEQWTPKVRSDVKGMVETGRTYDRIYFLTSRPVKAKKCHDEEQSLSDKYGVPITIIDREWIIEKVFSNRCEDIAFEDLRAGSYDAAKHVVGPRDHDRQRRLDAIETRLATAGQSASDMTQSVSDTFEAARLSRNLERPRLETEGRYLRATRFATKHGNADQVLRAKYESAWAELWWFDDMTAINENYEEIESLAISSGEASKISKVCNLMQVLCARVLQGWETEEFLNLSSRLTRLRTKLEDLSADTSRPNNALYSETLLAMLGLSDIKNKGNQGALDDIWRKLSDIIDRASGFGEYPADLIDEVVEAISSMAPNSSTLDELVEKLADFMGERRKQGKAGSLYLLRGNQKLKIDEPAEAIHWLGKASICFMKEEYREEQFETLYGLSVAYRGAGLLWAARSTCLASLVQLTLLSSADAEVRIETLPTISLLATISLELGRIPDLLLTILWLRNFSETLPITEDSKAHLEKRIADNDNLLSCMIAGLDESGLPWLAKMPDILEALGMFTSKIVLMYRLGRGEELVADELMPPDAGEDDLRNMVNMAASQPVSSSLPKLPRCNQDMPFEVTTTILGVSITFLGGNEEEDVLLCEVHLTALESFFATAFKNDIWPQAKRLTVFVQRKSDILVPSVLFDDIQMRITVSWPTERKVTDVDVCRTAGEHLITYCATVLLAIAALPNGTKTLDAMIEGEKLFERTTSFCFSHFAQGRVLGKNQASFEDLDHLITKEYDLVRPIPVVELSQSTLDVLVVDKVEEYSPPKSHKDMEVTSVINVHLWDKAGWKGMIYMHQGPQGQVPPVVGLMFSNREAAEAIFRGWSDLVGEFDRESLIRFSLLRGIDKESSHFYRVHISQNQDSFSDTKLKTRTFMMVSRLHTMTPANSENITAFLEVYEKFEAYYLVPAILGREGQPELLLDLAIQKVDLVVRDAWQVGPDDPDSVAIKEPEEVIVPSDVSDAPCMKIAEVRRQRRG
ncbi:hypothetical protein OO012_18685 [Rhodobacteraceae bacterium KMM 6894]|nr:hypothetical protein [Rhodobacteraceae bacterium KMM 6894]